MWQLPVSKTKFAILHVGRNKIRHHYNFFGAVIESKKEVRDLGILVDEKLRFDKHVNNITCLAHLRGNQERLVVNPLLEDCKDTLKTYNLRGQGFIWPTPSTLARRIGGALSSWLIPLPIYRPT